MNNSSSILTSAIVSIIFLSLITSANMIQTSDTPTDAEILSIDFSNEAEALKHLDTSSEVYGSAREYVDTSNQWFVFEGDNTQSNINKAIAVVKGYSEPDSVASFAVQPYNYFVSVDFMIPDSPQPVYGNMYILPRFSNSSYNYEVMIDTQNNRIVFNYVKNSESSTIGSVYFGDTFTIQRGNWYRFEVGIFWDYNIDEGKEMNHIYAKITDINNINNAAKAEIWDENILPNVSNGLAFMGYCDNQFFRVFIDNILVTASTTELGREPDEAGVSGWGGSDLDVSGLQGFVDYSNMFIRVPLESNINTASESKYWIIQLDVDKDSRNIDNGWGIDYNITIQIDTDGHAEAYLYDANGNTIQRLHILGGGIGYNYLVVQVPLLLIQGLQPSLYLYGYSELGSSINDRFPYDDTGNWQAGDYYIWYIQEPKPTSKWTYVNDALGDIDESHPAYFDIIELSSAHDDTHVFFMLSVGSNNIPWNGGNQSIVYRILIDADNRTDTGYYDEKTNIGADYLIIYAVGYAPRLYAYQGTGNDWNWEFLKKEDYIYNPGGSNNVYLIVPKSDFNSPALSNAIILEGQTGKDDTIGVDYTDNPLIAPIPEPGYLIAVAILIIAIIAWRYIIQRRT